MTPIGRGRYVVDGGAAELELSVQVEGQEALVVSAEGHAVRARLALFGAERDRLPGRRGLELADAGPAGRRGGRGGRRATSVVSPMPGLVARVVAEAGQAVEKGQALVVVEAMKMELTLRAPRDGTVAEILVRPGDQIADGTLLLTLAPEEG